MPAFTISSDVDAINAAVDGRIFADLPRDLQLALFNAWLDGHKVTPNGAPLIERPAWYGDAVYTVTAKPKTMPSIDWAHVAPKFNFLARDKNGNAYLYQTKPGIDYSSSGYGDRKVFMPADAFASYAPGDCDWNESLIERPRVEQHAYVSIDPTQPDGI